MNKVIKLKEFYEWTDNPFEKTKINFYFEIDSKQFYLSDGLNKEIIEFQIKNSVHKRAGWTCDKARYYRFTKSKNGIGLFFDGLITGLSIGILFNTHKGGI